MNMNMNMNTYLLGGGVEYLDSYHSTKYLYYISLLCPATFSSCYMTHSFIKKKKKNMAVNPHIVPKMEYRYLGKSGLSVSVIGMWLLGGNEGEF